MYRLLLYFLIAILLFALVLSALGILNFSPIALLASTTFLLIGGWITNKVFAYTFEAIPNVESTYITSLILACIITPPKVKEDLIFLFFAALLSMSSKFMFALNRKHLFNPAAIAVLLTSIVIGDSASWWVGTAWMLPVVLLGGLLVIRKMQRGDMLLSFFMASLLTIGSISFLHGTDVLVTLQKTFLESPILFFAFVMFTEPLTTPPTKMLQVYYGALVGFLFAPQLRIFGMTTTPESALVIGNIFSYLVSPKERLMLTLTEKRQYGGDTNEFIFQSDRKFSFRPGQYMEWTLGVPKADSRGNRRYFTLASSPTEKDVRVGVKFYEHPSRFKQVMNTLTPGTKITVSQLAGDFTLPKDKAEKLVFIAGGIGITPYRSILKYLIDTNERRDIVVFYANKAKEDIVYTDVLSQAETQLGIKTVYTLTDEAQIPSDWTGRRGRISGDMVKEIVPDFASRTFYLSGPHTMVTHFEDVLSQMGVKHDQLKIDFFPGFA